VPRKPHAESGPGEEPGSRGQGAGAAEGWVRLPELDTTCRPAGDPFRAAAEDVFGRESAIDFETRGAALHLSLAFPAVMIEDRKPGGDQCGTHRRWWSSSWSDC
jgi:hypothetical protein